LQHETSHRWLVNRKLKYSQSTANCCRLEQRHKNFAGQFGFEDLELQIVKARVK